MKTTHLVKIAFAASTLFVASCLYVPWQRTIDFTQPRVASVHTHQPLGYSLIFNPPAEPNSGYTVGFRVDFDRLFLEWAILAVLTVLSLLPVIIKPVAPSPKEPLA